MRTGSCAHVIRWIAPDLKTIIGWVVAVGVLVWSVSADRSSALLKVDDHGVKLVAHDIQIRDHAARLQSVESMRPSITDHEERLRRLEETMSRVANDVQWIRYVLEHGGAPQSGGR